MEDCIAPGSPGNLTPECRGRGSTQGRLCNISEAQVKDTKNFTSSLLPATGNASPWAGWASALWQLRGPPCP